MNYESTRQSINLLLKCEFIKQENRIKVIKGKNINEIYFYIDINNLINKISNLLLIS